MLVNPSVGRFRHHVDATVAADSGTPYVHSIKCLAKLFPAELNSHSLSPDCGSACTRFCSQAEPLLRTSRQVFGEFLSRQSHLKLLAARMRHRLDAVLLQSEPLLNKLRYLYGAPSSRKTVAMLIAAAIAGADADRPPGGNGHE